VLPGSVFCAAIHYLWALGIDEPCGTADTFCPGDDAARKVVVALLAGGFQLELYEP
jgi:hypothetical protein